MRRTEERAAYHLSTHLNFLSTALIFAAGSGVFFCAQPRSAGGVGSGKPRVVKGFGDGIAGSCGEPCADGPGRLCGRAEALTGFQRGVDNNQQLAGTGDDSGHF